MSIGLIVGICTLFFMVLHFTTTATYRAYNYQKSKKSSQSTQLEQVQQNLNTLTQIVKDLQVSK